MSAKDNYLSICFDRISRRWRTIKVMLTSVGREDSHNYYFMGVVSPRKLMKIFTCLITIVWTKNLMTLFEQLEVYYHFVQKRKHKNEKISNYSNWPIIKVKNKKTFSHDWLFMNDGTY